MNKVSFLLHTCISKCCRGDQKTSGGFIWKFKYENSIKDKIVQLDVVNQEEAYYQDTLYP